MPSPWKLGTSFVQMVGTISRRMKPRRSLDVDELSDEPTPKRPRASSSYRILSQGKEGTLTDERPGSEADGGDQCSRGFSFSGYDSGAVESTSDDGAQLRISKKPRFTTGSGLSGSRKRRREKNSSQEECQGDDSGLSEPEEEYPKKASAFEWRASKTYPNHAFSRRINLDEFGEKLVREVDPEPGFFLYPLITAEDILEPEVLAERMDSGAVAYRVPPTYSLKENRSPVGPELEKHSTMTKDGERIGKGKKRSFGEACRNNTQPRIASTNINASRENFTLAG